LGSALNVRYERDTTAATPRVLRGAIALGQGASEALPWPDQGVLVKLSWPNIDLDRWQAVMDSDALGGLGSPSAASTWRTSTWTTKAVALSSHMLDVP
jgi:uncharacterized protein YhdP